MYPIYTPRRNSGVSRRAIRKMDNNGVVQQVERDSPNSTRVFSKDRRSRRASIVSTFNTRMRQRNFTNYWTIEQFSVQMELNQPSEYLLAPTFGDSEYEFTLKLFPNGKDGETSGFMSLFLHINKCPNPRLRFRVSFMIETLDGPRNCALNKNLVNINRSGIVTASKFFSIDILKTCAARYLPNDTLTICVDMMIYGEALTSTGDLHRTPRNRNLNNSTIFEESVPLPDPVDYLHLLESGAFSDYLVVSADGKEFKTHMCILSSSSDYFRALLRTEKTVEANEKKVVFNDINENVLSIILCYIYSPTAGKALITQDSLSFELVAAIDRLMLTNMKEAVIEVICTDLSVDNVCHRLQLSEILSHDDLYAHLLSFFAPHKMDCIKTNEWTELRKSNPSLASRILEDSITKFDDLMIIPHSNQSDNSRIN